MKEKREAKITWESSLPKEDGDYIVTIQTEPYSNKGNKTVFAKFDIDKVKKGSYGFTYMDGNAIKDVIVAWAKKPAPYQGYFAPQNI